MNIVALAAISLGLLGSSSTSQAPLPPPQEVAVQIVHDNAYVDGSVSGAANVKARLKSQLADGDHVAIVMLPSADFEEVTSFLGNLDDATQHAYIIGFSAGDQIVGYSSALPNGVAADQMTRAGNVSMNVTETQLTFIRNIHNWLAQHPEVVLPSLPSEKSTAETPAGDSAFSWWPILVGSCVALLALFLVWVTYRKRSRAKKSFNAPDSVARLLVRIMEQRAAVTDAALREKIKTACEYTEAYFVRNTSPQYIESDTEQFCGHLENLLRVLTLYIDIQDNPHYYREPKASMDMGRDAVAGYADFALNSVRRGTDTRLVEFTVQTDILAAQRDI